MVQKSEAMQGKVMEHMEITSSLTKNRITVSPLLPGYAAMTAVLLVWSGFALSIRAIGDSPLTTADVAVTRFLVPFILLAPLLPSRLKAIRSARISDVAFILLAGLPFFFLASLGAQTTPAAYVGNILAGTQPLFVSVILFLLYRQLISRSRLMALSLILTGVFTMVLGQSATVSGEMVTGIGFLFAASIVWALFTVGLQRTGLQKTGKKRTDLKSAQLDPVSVALILSSISLLITAVLILCGAVESNLTQVSFADALPFILVQGVGVGVVATMGYTYAVRKLGSARSSILGSLSPGLTALLAVPVFAESLSLPVVIGTALTAAGVIWAGR